MLARQLVYSGKRMYVKFNGFCLRQFKTKYNYIKLWKNSKYIHCLCIKSALNYDEDITQCSSINQKYWYQ